MKRFYGLLLILILEIKFSSAQTWIQLPDFPSTERDDGISFVIDSKAYCGTGLQVGWSTTKDFYCFDFSTELWSTSAPLPSGKERQYACAFSYKGVGFVFGGNNTTALNDLWMYSPSSNSWIEKKSKPGYGLSGASCFVIDSFAYFVGGANEVSKASDEVWRYDCLRDVWKQMANTPFGGRWRASATETNGKGYLICGKDSTGIYHNQLFEYTANTDTWAQLAPFPNSGRTYSTLQSIESSLVVFGGMDSLNNYYNDLWYYDFSKNSWNQKSTLPASGRKGGMSFHSYSTLYYTTGIDQQNVRLKQTWKIENPTSLEDVSPLSKVSVFPNPCSDNFQIQYPQINIDIIELVDLMGNVVLHKKLQTNITNAIVVDVTEISNGLYTLIISSKNDWFQKKIAIVR